MENLLHRIVAPELECSIENPPLKEVYVSKVHATKADTLIRSVNNTIAIGDSLSHIKRIRKIQLKPEEKNNHTQADDRPISPSLNHFLVEDCVITENLCLSTSTVNKENGPKQIKSISYPTNSPNNLHSSQNNADPKHAPQNGKKPHQVLLDFVIAPKDIYEANEEILKDIVKEFQLQPKIIKVPAVNPPSRIHASEWSSRYWPLYFRPRKFELERLSSQDLQQIEDYLRMFASARTEYCNAASLSRGPSTCSDKTRLNKNTRCDATTNEQQQHQQHSCLFAAIINPRTGSIVASSGDFSNRILSLHTDTKQTISKRRYLGDPLAHSILCCINLASEQLRLLETGKKAKTNGSDSSSHESNLQFEYLLTGMDCYAVREPCAMCAMALVHSRIRRLVFLHKNHDNSGIELGQIHNEKFLNHKYEAFWLQHYNPDKPVVEALKTGNTTATTTTTTTTIS